MPIEVRCQCGKKLKAPERLAGRIVACPGCSAQIQVPALAETPDDDDFEDDAPPMPQPLAQKSAFGSPPQFSTSRTPQRPPQDDQRYSLREFVEETSQQDHGQGFFELESPYMLEVNLNGMVRWSPMSEISSLFAKGFWKRVSASY
jgi:hypothetical protein